jgi:hypothetical protein
MLRCYNRISKKLHMDARKRRIRSSVLEMSGSKKYIFDMLANFCGRQLICEYKVQKACLGKKCKLG